MGFSMVFFATEEGDAANLAVLRYTSQCCYGGVA